MSDDKDKPDSGADDAGGPLGGERLAEGRRALQIPIADIAKELHLDEYKVRALESNDFDVLGAPVFAKGHLRKYAQLVNVAEEDVMTDYYQLNRTSGAPPVLTARPRPRREMSPGPWIALIIIVVAAAAAYWWFGERAVTSLDRPAVDVVPAAEIEQTGSVEDAQTVVDVEDETVDEDRMGTATETVVEQPTPALAAEVVEEVDVSRLRLDVTFSGDCWTEITDANGRRLFFGLGAAGRTVNLNGEAPFNVLFGNADNVSLEVNGSPFELPAASRRGRTARLTISGS